jgi:hypothetical protein
MSIIRKGRDRTTIKLQGATAAVEPHKLRLTGFDSRPCYQLQWKSKSEWSSKFAKAIHCAL